MLLSACLLPRAPTEIEVWKGNTPLTIANGTKYPICYLTLSIADEIPHYDSSGNVNVGTADLLTPTRADTPLYKESPYTKKILPYGELKVNVTPHRYRVDATDCKGVLNVDSQPFEVRRESAIIFTFEEPVQGARNIQMHTIDRSSPEPATTSGHCVPHGFHTDDPMKCCSLHDAVGTHDNVTC